MRNLPLTFDRMYCSQKLGEDFAKILWPSQNIMTLIEGAVLVVSYTVMIIFKNLKICSLGQESCSFCRLIMLAPARCVIACFSYGMSPL